MSRPSSAPLSVLLVEHDLAYVRVVRATLAAQRMQTWSVEHVGALEAALDLLSSGSFDALLLDLDETDAAGGLEPLRRVVARFPALPVVVLMSWQPPPEALGLEALQQGAQDYIVKGDEERRLAKALRFAVERKRSHDAVLQLGKAADTTKLGISVTDLNGRIVYVNRAECDLHGYEPGELLGTDARNLSPRADWRPLSPEEMAGLTTWKRERVRMRKDGSTFPVQLMSDVVTDEAGRPLGVVTTCEDIGDRRRAEQALRESEERYALAVRGANDGIWDWSLRDDRLYVSERWREMLGHGGEELSASPHEWFSRLHPEDAARVRQKIDDHLAGASPHFEDEHRMRHKSGRYLWVLTRGFALRGPDGTAVRMAGAQTDVTDRRAHDPLTGLPNRALMTERLEQALARSQRHADDAFAVLFVDLDHFKAVNDTLGHAAGDVLLMEVARRLEGSVRPGDMVGRLAGDEFGLLLERITDVDEALQAADRIQHDLKQSFSWEGCPLRLSASVGIAISTTGYDTAEQILHEADTAMYRAKAAGRGRFELFDTGMRERLRERQRLVDSLRQALRRGELHLVYQPIVALDGAHLVAMEALLRWNHPEGGLLSPPEVLALAEHTGELSRIESWTLAEACTQARRWRDQGFPLPVAVNVSGRQCRRSDLVEEVLDVLDAQGLRGEDLWLDVTESCLVHNPVAAGHVVRLRTAGVRLFLDDFGAGTSPLALLAEWPLDGLKLDLTLVAALAEAPEPPLLTAIMAAAGRLGLPMIAEGVETAAQRDRLCMLGCALGQGTHFAAPLSAEDALAIIAATTCPDRPSDSGTARPASPRSRPRSSLPSGRRPKPDRPRRKSAPLRPTSS